jgi:hypothetical protein
MTAGRNSEAAWDQFDPEIYYDDNYRTLLRVDRDILELLGGFFAGSGLVDGRGIDVGAGANLYPSLAMLPFCRHIELRDFAEPNVAWLRKQAPHYGEAWNGFWDVLAGHAAYRQIASPRSVYAERVAVEHGDVFALEPRSWDIGTMFFVACSLSTTMDEFRAAVERFVGALRPGAPFAAAFMLRHTSYEIGGLDFPGVWLTASDLDAVFRALGASFTVTEIDTRQTRFAGMALVLGRTADHE